MSPKKTSKSSKKAKTSDEDFDELEGIEVPDKLFFRIGETAELVGVEPHVLRYWESEFKMRPQRSKSGQRMYRRKDIARFLRIRRLLHEEGFTIAGARKAMSDGAEAPSAAVPELREVLGRLEGLRERVAGARARFDQVLNIEIEEL